jgi:hypothetical protein
VELSDAGQTAVARLAAALDKPAGQKWPDAVLDDVLAILVLATAPLDALDPIEEAILASFSARIALPADASGQLLAAKIGDHFAKHPLPIALATEVSAALKELMSTNNAAHAAAALGTAAGKDAKVPVGQRDGAAGSLRMGVMGRFALAVPPKAPPK